MIKLPKTPLAILFVSLILVASVIGGTDAIIQPQTSEVKLTIHLIGKNDNPLSGVKVYAINSSTILESGTTNATGYAEIQVPKGKMIILTSGPIIWSGIDVQDDTLIQIWLNMSEFHEINITSIVGSVGDSILFNATFLTVVGEPSNVITGSIDNKLKAPVKVYVPTDVSADTHNMVMQIPENITKLFSILKLANVTITKADNTTVVSTSTTIEVNSTVTDVKILYIYVSSWWFSWLTSQYLIAIAMVLILAVILVVIVKTKKVASETLHHYKSRRTIRKYEILGEYNGFLESIDSKPIEEKDRIARRILKRVG